MAKILSQSEIDSLVHAATSSGLDESSGAGNSSKKTLESASAGEAPATEVDVPSENTGSEGVKEQNPEETQHTIEVSADTMVDQFKGDIPDHLRREPPVETLIGKVDTAREVLHDNIEDTLHGTDSEGAEKPSNVLEWLGGYFEERYAGVDDAAITLGSKAEVKAMYEALQGKLGSKDFFTPSTFSFEQDGAVQSKTGKSVYDFLKGARVKSEMFANTKDGGEVAEEHAKRLLMIDAALGELEKIKAESEKTPEKPVQAGESAVLSESEDEASLRDRVASGSEKVLGYFLDDAAFYSGGTPTREQAIVSAMKEKIASGDFDTQTQFVEDAGGYAETKSTEQSPKIFFQNLRRELKTRADRYGQSHPGEKNPFAEKVQVIDDTLRAMREVGIANARRSAKKSESADASQPVETPSVTPVKPEGEVVVETVDKPESESTVLPEPEKVPEPESKPASEVTSEATPEPTPEPVLEPTPTPEPILEPAFETPKPPETDTEKEPSKEKPATLEELRNAYAFAVNGRKKFFGRTSMKHVEEMRGAYEKALKEKFADQLKTEFAGLDIKSMGVLEKYLERQAEITTQSMQERELLVDALSSTQEKTAGKKFTEFWKKHSKLRMAVGLGLTGGALVTGAMGILPASAAFLAGRTVLSGVGSGMMTGQVWEGVRQRFGKKTKEMSKEDIEKMSYKQLEEYYAAQSVGAADRGVKRNEKVTFFGRKKESETAKLVAEALEKKRADGLKEGAKKMQEKGRSAEDIIANSLHSMMTEEERGHAMLEGRTDWLRKNNMKKWVTSIAAGTIMAGLVGVRGFQNLREMATAKEVVEPTGPKAPNPEDLTTPAPEDVPNPETTVPPGDSSTIPGPEAGPAPEAAAGVESAQDVVTVGKGDSVWKIIENQLHEKMGDKFASLSEGEKTHLIDQFKDRVVENPGKFGLEDADVLKPGTKLDLTELFKDSNIDDAVGKTAELSQDQIHNIEANNEILRKWVLEHPAERLTSGNVDSIIDQAKHAATTVAENAGSTMSSEQFAAGYTEWLKEHPDMAKMNFKDSVIRYAMDQQNATEQLAEQTPPEVHAAYDPIRQWVEQNPGKALDKETFLKIVNTPYDQEVLATTEQLRQEISGRIPEALQSLAKHAEFLESGRVIELKAGVKALKQVGEVTNELLKDGNEQTVKALTELKLSDIMRGIKGTLEKMQGMDDDMAKKFAKAAKEIVKQADKANGDLVDRNWTLGMLSRVVRLTEKGK